MKILYSNIHLRDNPGIMEIFTILFFYFIFFTGALWHILDRFQPIMKGASGPLLLFCIGLVIIETSLKNPKANNGRFFLWFFVSALAGWLIELLGSTTGIPFGDYMYSAILQPQFLNVPISVAFSWPLICYASLFLARSILDLLNLKESRWYVYLLIGISLIWILLFDITMEPSAVILHYWTWKTDSIPIQNYLAWTGFALIVNAIGIRIKIHKMPLATLAVHFYFSQIVYFGLIRLFKGGVI